MTKQEPERPQRISAAISVNELLSEGGIQRFIENYRDNIEIQTTEHPRVFIQEIILEAQRFNRLMKPELPLNLFLHKIARENKTIVLNEVNRVCAKLFGCELVQIETGRREGHSDKGQDVSGLESSDGSVQWIEAHNDARDTSEQEEPSSVPNDLSEDDL